MLEISNLDVYYGDLQALWGISLSVEDGSVVTLVGSNGAGKSTLMQAIAGLLTPKAGSITFDGLRLDRLPAHRIVKSGVCMVPEGRRLFPRMTILENLEVGASTARKARQETLGWVYEVFPRSKATAPATWGADAEVPEKPSDPYVIVETPEGADRSGLILPSMVGPWELYDSYASVCQSVAPTANA